jgi:hypothetical protein
MPVIPSDRPISALREEAIDQLVVNYAHGKLSLAAFERRLDQVLQAETHEALETLTADLESFPQQAISERRKREVGINMESRGGKAFERFVNVFSGTNKKGPWTVAKRVEIVNVFGGAELDLSQARFSGNDTRIKLHSIFGGMTIYVPEGMNILNDSVCVFSGIEDSSPASTDANAPTLTVEGFMLFSGLQIKTKRSLKERLQDFAASVRQTFGATRPV